MWAIESDRKTMPERIIDAFREMNVSKNKDAARHFWRPFTDSTEKLVIYII